MSNTYKCIANWRLRAGDVSRASSKLKGELPGKANQVQKDAEKWGADVGAKVDNAVRAIPTYVQKKSQMGPSTARRI
jgi:hypothetical protein